MGVNFFLYVFNLSFILLIIVKTLYSDKILNIIYHARIMEVFPKSCKCSLIWLSVEQRNTNDFHFDPRLSIKSHRKKKSINDDEHFNWCSIQSSNGKFRYYLISLLLSHWKILFSYYRFFIFCFIDFIIMVPFFPFFDVIYFKFLSSHCLHVIVDYNYYIFDWNFFLHYYD